MSEKKTDNIPSATKCWIILHNENGPDFSVFDNVHLTEKGAVMVANGLATEYAKSFSKQVVQATIGHETVFKVEPDTEWRVQEKRLI